MAENPHQHGHGSVHRRDHRYGWARCVRSQLRHMLTPHSHDSNHRIDTALQTSKRGMRALTWSFAALFVTATTQLIVALLSGSMALLGDTIHNFADALTAVPIGIALLLGRRIATRRYTYGLGRAEDLAGVVVVLIIAASAALAGYQSVLRLMHPQPVGHLWVVAAAGVIGFTGNELVARCRITVGRQIGSAALIADGLHARTDGLTSLAVVLGALGVTLGFPLADPIVGLGIAIAIVFVLRDATKEVFRRLMDAVDPATVERAQHTATAVPGVRDVGAVRMRWIGHTLRSELSVTVDAELTVEQAHHIAHDVEHQLVHAIPRLTAAIVHIEPDTSTQIAHDALAHHR